MAVFPWGDGQSRKWLVLDWSPGLCPYCTDGGVGPGGVQKPTTLVPSCPVRSSRMLAVQFLSVLQ